MSACKAGIVHPGAMGIYVAASMQNSGSEVWWASSGRSAATAARAAQFRLHDAGTLAALCTSCDIIVSVCPPHGALEVAREVANLGFKGIYLDANAVSPMTAKAIDDLFAGTEIDFVDGGIIGPPAWPDGNSSIYLSGSRADDCAQFFCAGPLRPQVIGDGIGKASAIKMCYAAYTKGTSALLANILALAENHQIRTELTNRWEEDWPGLPAAARTRIQKSALKGWRFSGEMEEIAATFEDCGLPGDFHRGATRIYSLLAGFKSSPEMPDLEDILRALLGN